VICSLVNKHTNTSTNQQTNETQNCMCVCHMPSIFHQSFYFQSYFSFQGKSFAVATFFPTAPTRSIYHPPKIG
ncbi:MAG: hypothetical protein AAB071_02015, partial [Bacteroidota bacterium]